MLESLSRSDSPAVVSFEREEPEALKRRAARLVKARNEAHDAVNQACHSAGLLDRPYISPGAERLTGFHGLRCHEWSTGIDYQFFFERQAERYRRILRRALASEALTDDVRGDILQGLHGLRGRQLDTRALSDAERRLIEHYRGLGADDRHMLRTLLTRLGATTSINGGQGGAR